MDQLLNNIKNIPGVVGVAVFRDNGSVAAFDFPPAYDKTQLSQMGLKFQPIKDILPQNERDIIYLCWEYEDLLAFYYPVTGGWVNIISNDKIPMPMFSLTMTAVSIKFPELLAKKEQLLPPSLQGHTPAPVPSPSSHTVPQAKIEELEKLLATYLGPAASVIFKRTAAHLGYLLTDLPGNILKPLLEGVISKVPDNKKDEVNEKVKKYL